MHHLWQERPTQQQRGNLSKQKQQALKVLKDAEQNKNMPEHKSKDCRRGQVYSDTDSTIISYYLCQGSSRRNVFAMSV